jgi:hypothetical protein
MADKDNPKFHMETVRYSGQMPEATDGQTQRCLGMAQTIFIVDPLLEVVQRELGDGGMSQSGC